MITEDLQVIDINICWNGTVKSLRNALNQQVVRVTNGRYNNCKVIRSKYTDFSCENGMGNIHRTVTVELIKWDTMVTQSL